MGITGAQIQDGSYLEGQSEVGNLVFTVTSDFNGPASVTGSFGDGATASGTFNVVMPRRVTVRTKSRRYSALLIASSIGSTTAAARSAAATKLSPPGARPSSAWHTSSNPIV